MSSENKLEITGHDLREAYSSAHQEGPPETEDEIINKRLCLPPHEKEEITRALQKEIHFHLAKYFVVEGIVDTVQDYFRYFAPLFDLFMHGKILAINSNNGDGFNIYVKDLNCAFLHLVKDTLSKKPISEEELERSFHESHQTLEEKSEKEINYPIQGKIMEFLLYHKLVDDSFALYYDRFAPIYAQLIEKNFYKEAIQVTDLSTQSVKNLKDLKHFTDKSLQ